jgi:hypothetical protein
MTSNSFSECAGFLHPYLYTYKAVPSLTYESLGNPSHQLGILINFHFARNCYQKINLK